MKLTLARLRAVYTMLLECPPFDGWHLPPVGEVKFSMKLDGDSDEDTIAHYNISLRGRHEISFDQRIHWTLPKLTAIMAHEICHLRQEQLGRRPGGERGAQHNATFKHLATLACKHLGFDGTDF